MWPPRTLLVAPPMIQVYCPNVPSEKLLIATFDGDSDRNLSVTFGSPSRIMRCTIISPLKTIVHVESRNRCVKVRKTSATPTSPACVATRRCSTYFDLGAASFSVACQHTLMSYTPLTAEPTFCFVAPLTDFSNDWDMLLLAPDGLSLNGSWLDGQL